MNECLQKVEEGILVSWDGDTMWTRTLFAQSCLFGLPYVMVEDLP